MSNIPSFRARTVRFRTKTSSADQNEMVEDILYDLNNVFNLVNEQEALLNDVKETLDVEKKYQNIRIEQLLVELEETKELYRNLQAGLGRYAKKTYVDSFVTDPDASDLEKAEIETYYGIATLPVVGKKTSKVFLYDDVTQEVVLPDSLRVLVEPLPDGTTVQDNNVFNAFNGDNHSIWRRKYVYPVNDPTTEVTTVITITLPDNIISNRDINTILISAFPLSTVDINKIEYRLNGGWKLIPAWKKDSAGNPITVADSGNLKLCFESLSMSQVRITLTQRNFIIQGHKKIFYVGAQEIGILHSDYQSSVGRFMVPIKLKGQLESKLIAKVIPHFKNADSLSDKSEEKRSVFNYTIYGVDNAGELEYTRDTLPIVVQNEDIVIKASINMDSQTGATPALESIEVVYEDFM